MLLEVRPLERYPVDLYYLVDVSASMQENLDQVGGSVSCFLKPVVPLCPLCPPSLPWSRDGLCGRS